MDTSPPGAIRFEDFALDARAGELLKQGDRIRLQEKPLRVLKMLLARPGEVITREELQQALWSADTFVDFDGGLNTAVNKLRAALGDIAEKPRFVETVGRRGYRFIGPVLGGDTTPVRPTVAPERGEATAPAETQRPLRRHLPTTAAVLSVALLLAGATAWWTYRARQRQAPGVERIRSLAVLPLQSLSADPDQQYFAEGMTDALITGLASSMRTLRVTSRQSVLGHGDHLEPMAEIARELDVDAIVQGTVARGDGRMRVTAQLIDARRDTHLWAGSYERELRDVLALQDEVARAIAGQIQIALTPPGGDRTVNADAYEAYLRGRYLWNRVSEDNLQKALAAFEHAVEIDPGFALAHIGIADSYARLAWYGHVPGGEAAARMKNSILRALSLDDSLAEAHSALGAVAAGDFDWPLAEKELRLALELNPSDAIARLRLGLVYEILGRQAENLSERRRAAELDPLNLTVNAALGEALFYAGDPEAALRQVRKTHDLDPSFSVALRVLGLVLESQGQCPEAIDVYTKAGARGELGYALATCGHPAEARAVLDDLERSPPTSAVSPLDVAAVHAGLGQTDEALAWLEKAYDERVPALPHVRVEPQFAALRSDPRFQDLLRRMRLPAVAPADEPH